MNFFRELAYLDQRPYESTYDYFERTKYYVNECPHHGFRFHELINHFLDGMFPEKRFIMDTMAEGSIMDYTQWEVWNLIEERADRTRPYTECSPELEDIVFQFAQAVSELEKIMEKLTEFDKQVAVLSEEICELKSAPEPAQVYVGDDAVMLSTKERADEEIMDEELQVVPIMSIEDVPTEE